MLLVCSASAFINTSITVAVFSFYSFFVFIGLGFVILFDVLFSKIISSATLRSHSSLSSHHSEVKFMKSVKRNIISQNFFLSFQVFTSIFFWKVYEKREKGHHQSEFISRFSSFCLKILLKSLWKARKRTSTERISFLVFKFLTQIILKSLWKPEKEHYQ